MEEELKARLEQFISWLDARADKNMDKTGNIGVEQATTAERLRLLLDGDWNPNSSEGDDD